jgi:hypothetical protein
MQIRENPVTGSHWISGVDPVEPQMQAAWRALLARQWFAETGPRGAPPLPLSYEEREKLKIGGPFHIEAWFAESLRCHDEYDYETHPLFDEYARGVMASPYAPDFIKQDQELLKHYPPRALPGLGPGLVWQPG